MNKKLKCRSILFFNPWIYDFAAYDFWYKPLGLLYNAAFLKSLGYQVSLIDCMDRYHPALAEFLGPDACPHDKNDKSGKFYRQEIEKPKVVDFVPRKFCRYGMPPELVIKLLEQLTPKPDIIAVTSFLTYWYPGVRDAVTLLRSIFPEIPVVLGGVYAGLCPDHARHVIQPDYLIHAEGELQFARLLAELNDEPFSLKINHLDELPFPAFELYPRCESIALTTSRGCPNRCSFCASSILSPHYRRRSSHNVISEIQQWYEEYQIHHFALYDDALLHQRKRHIHPVLQHVIERKWNLNFYTPNGLTPRFIDEETSELFYHAAVQHIKLSFETIDPARQKRMSAKVNAYELEQAIDLLEKAGYKRKDIGVYLMMGLPGQSVQEVKQSAEFVNQLGAKIHLNSFSPIPGTLEWQHAIDQKLWQENSDLLLTNTTIFPILSKTIGYDAAKAVVTWAKELNAKLV